MQSMCEALKKMGLSEEDGVMPPLDSCEIVSTAEELLKLDEASGETPAKNKTAE